MTLIPPGGFYTPGPSAPGGGPIIVTGTRLLGRYEPTTGLVQEIVLGTNLSLAGNTLNATAAGGGGAVNSVAGLVGSISAGDLKTALTLPTVATTGAYDDLTGKPTLGTAASAAASSFAPATHTHAQSEIVGLTSTLSAKAATGPAGSSGLTMTSGRLLGRYDPSTGAIQEITLGSNLSLSGNTLNAAGGGGGGAVDSVAGLTGTILAADLKTALALHDVASSGAYSDLSGKPTLGTAAAAAISDFAAATHTHAQAEITGLVSALSGKANAAHTHATSDVTGLDTALAGKAPTSHTHAQSDITGLSTSLSGKANATHTHATSDVTGLDTALAGKASTSHTHAAMTGASSGAAGAAGFVPQPAAGDQGKVLKGDGTWGSVTAATVSVAKGTGGSGSTQTFNVGAGGHQSLTVGGALTVATSGWPATGQLGELVIELVNGGSALVTWPSIRWVKSDGSYTTTFTSNGVLLQASGTDWIYLWSTDGGTTVWGKVMR